MHDQFCCRDAFFWQPSTHPLTRGSFSNQHIFSSGGNSSSRLHAKCKSYPKFPTCWIYLLVTSHIETSLMTHQGKQCITVSWIGFMNFMSITNSKAFLWIVDDHKVKACTCTEVTSWVVQNRRRSSRRWARRRCRSSVCLPCSSAWSRSSGWRSRASPWCIHLHKLARPFPHPWWRVLQTVIYLCDAQVLFISFHISLSITFLLGRVVFTPERWSMSVKHQLSVL